MCLFASCKKSEEPANPTDPTELSVKEEIDGDSDDKEDSSDFAEVEEVEGETIDDETTSEITEDAE